MSPASLTAIFAKEATSIRWSRVVVLGRGYPVHVACPSRLSIVDVMGLWGTLGLVAAAVQMHPGGQPRRSIHRDRVMRKVF